MRDWVTNVRDTHYIIGTVAGPHPYPTMVRDFQSVIGIEARQQLLEDAGKLPDLVVACVGGGSNAMGIFYPFVHDAGVRLIGVEAAGRGIHTGEHAATLTAGSKGVLHGSSSYILQDEYGQVIPTHSISAGLDYPGVGPEHAHFKDTGRAEYVSVTDDEAVEAFQWVCRTEGIIPALEVMPRFRPRPQARPHPAPRPNAHRLPLRARRQGRGPGGEAPGDAVDGPHPGGKPPTLSQVWERVKRSPYAPPSRFLTLSQTFGRGWRASASRVRASSVSQVRAAPINDYVNPNRPDFCPTEGRP